MNIKIRHAKRVAGAYGNTSFYGPKKAIITISRALNRRLSTYAATLLHELLHVWTKILENFGFEIDDKTEHDFIYACERAILKEFRAIVGKKGRK